MMGDVKKAEYTRTCAVFNNAGKRIGGTRKQATMGEVLCGGLFGVHEEGGYGGYAVLTHIPTGRSIGHSFKTKGRAKRCARALMKLDIDWTFTTLVEWNAIRSGPEYARAKKIIETWRHNEPES